MIIKHPTKIRWQKTLSDDILSDYSKNNRIKLRSSLPKIESESVTYTIEELDEDNATWFDDLYKQTIGQKTNPAFFDIKKTTLEADHGYPYSLLTIIENDSTLGGIIFSVREDRLNLAYKVFPIQWNQAQLKASPTLYADYAVSQHTQNLGKQYLSHGKDRNPYGKNANIGLASYKLSVGCRAYLPEEVEYAEFNTESLSATSEDILLLETPTENTDVISTAKLFTHNPDREDTLRVSKYKNLLAVEIIEIG